MVEKRKRPTVSTSDRRSSTTKRQSSVSTPAPTSEPPRPPSPFSHIPTSISRDEPLPVLPERQPEDLQLKDFKSVAESKVLSESLARSQRFWADGDIFEKFWIKQRKSRKLDPALIEKNPNKETMVRLGPAVMTCMPHRFDLRMFSVVQPIKPPPTPQPPQTPTPAPVAPTQQPIPMTPVQRPSVQQPVQQPILQPVPQPIPQSVHQIQQPQAPSAQLQPPTTPRTPVPTPQAAPQHTASSPVPHPQIRPPVHPPPPPNPPQAPPQAPLQPVAPQPQTPAPVATPIQQPLGAPPRPPTLQTPQPSPAQPQTDPVIQLLAMRAATDGDLKQLMRIVASGKATRDQLQEFQRHIDILTAEAGLSKPGARPPQPQGPPSGTPIQRPPGQLVPQQPGPMITHPQGTPYQHYPQQPHIRPQQYHTPAPPPQPKPRSYPQTPKHETIGIIFEFLDPYSQGDRFLFPKYTILEYLNRGHAVRASFIATRKIGEESFYQPITIVIEAQAPKIIETLHRVVADQDTTRAHMTQIMSTMKRADDTFLVYRLRREEGEPIPTGPVVPHLQLELPPAKSRRTLKEKENTPTSSTVPKSRPVKKDAAESNCIVSVSMNPGVATTTMFVGGSLSTSSPSDSTTPSASWSLASPPYTRPPRSRKGRIADPTKNCYLCDTSHTSLWRKALINGLEVTLCNACGIKKKTAEKKSETGDHGSGGGDIIMNVDSEPTGAANGDQDIPVPPNTALLSSTTPMSTTAASPHTTDTPSIPIFMSKRRKIFRRRERSESPPATSTNTTTSETAPTTFAASLEDSPPSPPPVKPAAIRRPVRRFGLEVSSQANGSHTEGSTSTSNPDAGTGANALASSADSDVQAVINRFTHQTGQILDVDKHMMAYIESRMSSSSVTPRPPPSQPQQQPPQQSDSKPISASTTQSSPPSPSSRSTYPQNSESRGATLGKLHEVDLGEDARRRNILRTTAALSSTTSTNLSSSAAAAAATASTAATSTPSQDRTPHPLTLIAPSPPITAATLSTTSPQPSNRARQKKLKRTLADTERDLLVEQVLAEYSTAHPNSTVEQSDPWDLNQNGEDADMAADDRIAEKFRKEFVDAMLSKRRRRGDGAGSQSAQKKKGEEKRPKGPKLGGSRMARQMMREREMGKK
ncbi:hypothetical protein EX30DRAFT_363300 [Ascodesmis nigricans]|uniref:GATA-type domain-containing protein n=1 Tax=Ascodesmis nigricans TaxID=341454 RepID=A0A4S2MZW9_9PEZI|nr:hypothetical protein EX30DRAFT_363300 [Ascodesmis nigricans]